MLIVEAKVGLPSGASKRHARQLSRRPWRGRLYLPQTNSIASRSECQDDTLCRSVKIYKLLVEHLILHETPGGSHRQSNLSQVASSSRSIGLHFTHRQMRLQRRQPGFCIAYRRRGAVISAVAYGSGRLIAVIPWPIERAIMPPGADCGNTLFSATLSKSVSLLALQDSRVRIHQE